LSNAQLQGADLSSAKLQGANLRNAKLQGADLSFAQLQGADLLFANLQGANVFDAAIWLASFPFHSELFYPSPAPLGVTDLKMLPLTADAKAKLKKDLQAAITDNELLESVMDRLDPILRDDPPKWEDEDRWRRYISLATEPSNR
jgi:hypothetical protein